MTREQKLEEALKNLISAADRAGVCDDLMAELMPDNSRSGQPRSQIVKAAQRAMNEARAALSIPKAEAVIVKPLDLSNVAKHAFLSGVVAARNVPGHEECIGPDLWVDYDPTGEPPYQRILSAIDTSPVPAITDEAVERALAEWSKPNDKREPAEIMRAALKAAMEPSHD